MSPINHETVEDHMRPNLNTPNGTTTIGTDQAIAWLRREIPRLGGGVALVRVAARRELGLTADELDVLTSAAGFAEHGGKFISFAVSPEPAAPPVAPAATAPTRPQHAPARPTPSTTPLAAASTPASRAAPPVAPQAPAALHDNRSLRARIEAIVLSPEARGREALALGLVTATCTVDAALLVLRAAARDPDAAKPAIDTAALYASRNNANRA